MKYHFSRMFNSLVFYSLFIEELLNSCQSKFITKGTPKWGTVSHSPVNENGENPIKYQKKLK